MNVDRKHLIFTDLDGTLLDHDTYSYAPVEPILKTLKQLDVPVIPVTSKTKSEVLALRKAIKLTTPFVCENGAAIYVPKSYFAFTDQSMLDQGEYWCKAFAPTRAHWVDIINNLPQRWQSNIRHFSVMSNAEISTSTGLSLQAATLANEREYSEPILWLGADTEKVEFIQFMQGLGHTVLEGGRFLHLTNGYDKGRALVWLKQQYMKAFPNLKAYAIALGDSGNDIEMLEASDQAIIVRSKVNSALCFDSLVNEIRTQKIGPEGWAEAITQLLNLNA